jgi:hypothetical protein
MLKLGYGMILLACGALVGFAIFHLFRLLFVSAGIALFFKILITIGGIGVLLTIAGLIRERFKEERDVHRDE